ncbi:MAG: GNAT family N-acetyltransferase [Ktedonobacteraceae bacterium]
MRLDTERQSQVAAALEHLQLPEDIVIRMWQQSDFPTIQKLSRVEGWTTPELRPQDALAAWQHSWPTLVATDGESIVGFVRALTDGEVNMFVTELLIDARLRGQGIGRALLDVCHYLYPRVRIDLISTEQANGFYLAHGFRFVGEGLRKSYI